MSNYWNNKSKKKGYFMKDYMVAHTFKSEELRDQYFEMSASMTEDDIRSNMKNESASFQMNWNNEKNDMLCIAGGKLIHLMQ